jgi:hypothetical protein
MSMPATGVMLQVAGANWTWLHVASQVPQA